MTRAAASLLLLLPFPALAGVDLVPVGTWCTGAFDEGGAEIAAFDPATARLFVVNGAAATLDVLDLSDPTAPTLVTRVDVTPWGGGANSVAVHDGLVAVAVEADPKQDPGLVLFLDTDGAVVGTAEAGALPDMLTFTPDGSAVVVADEGEPDATYSDDPAGSVTIVDLSAGVAAAGSTHVYFDAFVGGLDPDVRVFGPGADASTDLEPEYVAVSHDGKTAWVTLQENAALAIVDLRDGVVTDVVPLGAKDHTLPGAGLDPSDKDGGVAIATWPVHGLYQPDAVATVRHRGRTYLLTANEGDARDYDGFSEEARVADVVLDPDAFPGATALQDRRALGRLKITTTLGDDDGDGDYDALYSFGTRSFSVWDAAGTLVWDSGEQLERLTALAEPALYNADNAANGADTRSDDKGPEPEGLVVGKVAGRDYVFVGLERTGGIAVYDVSDPTAPTFADYASTRNPAGHPAMGTAGDLGPEGLLFVPAEESPTGVPLLVVCYEVSGTVGVFEVRRTK